MDFKSSKYKILGVINRTPNCFSCNGYSLDNNHLFNQIKLNIKLGAISDFGFESTAPMNSSISMNEELSRFDKFLEDTKSFDFSEQVLSLDTYRPKSFAYMTKSLLRLHPRIKGFVFNDVSGVIDSELIDTLNEVKSFTNKDIYYVYNFTFLNSREEIGNHSKIIRPNLNIIESCINAFVDAKNKLNDTLKDEFLILDPGFGFCKSLEQNWDLINGFGYFNHLLNIHNLTNIILIGLSKKRFLVSRVNSSDGDELEKLHKMTLEKLLSLSSNRILFRVHNPNILNS